MVLGPVADHATPRNETLRATRHDGRAFRTRWSGYHARRRTRGEDALAGSLEPVAFTCATSKLSENASRHETRTARPPKSRSASFAGSLEPVAFACSVINRFNALGTAEIVRMA